MHAAASTMLATSCASYYRGTARESLHNCTGEQFCGMAKLVRDAGLPCGVKAAALTVPEVRPSVVECILSDEVQHVDRDA